MIVVIKISKQSNTWEIFKKELLCVEKNNNIAFMSVLCYNFYNSGLYHSTSKYLILLDK